MYGLYDRFHCMYMYMAEVCILQHTHANTNLWLRSMVIMDSYHSHSIESYPQVNNTTRANLTIDPFTS